MKYIAATILILATAAAGGCSVNKYTPPIIDPAPPLNSVVVDAPFDVVWARMVAFSAETFFGLENIEKESGIITLSFSGNPPSQFIDGGHWDYTPLVKSSGYSADYADYLAASYGGALTGKVNIFVSETTPGKTLVKVKARYNFTCPPNSWIFETGTSATQDVQTNNLGSKSSRTMAPNYAIERMVVAAARGDS